MWIPPTEHPLRRLFAGLTEQTFLTTLGVADPPLVDYLSLLLTRFIHFDDIYALRDAAGRPLHELVDMLLEAQKLPAEGRTTREVYRHIGDFALFWTGIFPEFLEQSRRHYRAKDAFVDYCTQGKRSYLLASQFEDSPYQEEAPILRRIAEQFELCAYGLNRVRREWQHFSQEE
jgi:hypothetical protein